MERYVSSKNIITMPEIRFNCKSRWVEYKLSNWEEKNEKYIEKNL